MSREIDTLVADKVMGLVPCTAWKLVNLGSAGGPCWMLEPESACTHWLGPATSGVSYCYPAPDDSPLSGPRPYSTDIAAAFEVVAAMQRRGYDSIANSSHDPFTRAHWGGHLWHAGFGRGPSWTGESCHAYADTAPEAICHAALVAVGAIAATEVA
jgi:hypothetical protein